jgi:glutaredoxin-like protein NrdH
MKLYHVPGKKKADIKLFALSTCPWCKKTKALLDSLGVEYSFVDVDLLNGADRDEATAIVKKWNPSQSFPVIVFNDAKCIIGYRENDIRAALGL